MRYSPAGFIAIKSHFDKEFHGKLLCGSTIFNGIYVSTPWVNIKI